MGKSAKPGKPKKPVPEAEEAKRPRKKAAVKAKPKATAPKALAKAGAAKGPAKVKARAKPKAKLKPAKWKEDLRVLHPLPVPEDLADAPINARTRPPKRVRRAETRHLGPLDPGGGDPVPAVLDRLWATVEERRLSGDTQTSHSARLLSRGTAKVAQKLGEEAVETVIEAMAGNRGALIGESADLLYHLIVVWVDAGIRPDQVWAELVRREGISGIAEKASRPHGIARAAGTTKLP